MNKKAQEKTVLNTIIDLILVTLALLALFGVYKGLISLLSNDQKISENNFEELVRTINDMDIENREIPLYIEDSYFVFGIGKKNKLESGFSIPGLDDFDRPIECYGMSCLCLCSKEDGCNGGICTTKLDKEFEFTDGVNNYAVILGNEKNQIAYLYNSGEQITISNKKT
jgi:hypothetical protein